MSEYTAENLGQFKTVELRKLAKEFGVQKINRDGVEVSVNTGRKEELVTEILRQQEFAATFVSAEGRTNPNRHPVYGWPIAGEQKPIEIPEGWTGGMKKSVPALKKARRTETGEVKGQMCAECGERRVSKKTQGADSTMCTECFEYAGWENAHSDEDHEKILEIDGWKRTDEDQALVQDCPVCAKNSKPAVAGISPKALRFEKDAKAAGWSAITRTEANGSGASIVTATAEDGREIKLAWFGRVYDYDSSELKVNGKSRKVRNASAARKILAGE